MAIRWTGPMQKTAVELYIKGGSKLVEKEMSIEPASTRHKMHTLGIKTNYKHQQRGFYAEDIAAMFDFRELGLSYEAIAIGFKSTANSIKSMLVSARKNGFDAYPLRCEP
tara:strand:- start:113 stop:442 length:330 start_codon:yes stop_codon:yes gene_type:complete